MVFLYTTKIGGTTVSDANLIGQRYNKVTDMNKLWASVEIEIPIAALTTYSVSIGSTVTVQYGSLISTEHYLFRGTVEDIRPLTTSAVLVCYDKLYQLTKRSVNESYSSSDALAGVISDIIIDIITNFGGLTADTGSVDDTGVLTIKETLILRDRYAYDAVKDLCNIVKYIFYYNPDDDHVYAHLKGKDAADDNFTVGTNVIGKPEWNYDGTNVISYLKIYGASKSARTIELFSGTGMQTDFQLGYVPDKNVAITVEENVVGTWTERKLGIPGVSATYDYSFDPTPTIRTITFVDNIPGAGASNVRVTYNKIETLNTEQSNDTTKANYPTTDGGYRERVVFNNYIETITDLETTAATLLDVGSTTYDTCKLKVSSLTHIPEISQKTHVTDIINDENRDMIVRGISFTYPGQQFVIQVEEELGKVEDYIFTNEQRLKRLEEESSNNATFSRKLIQVTPTINFSYDFIGTYLEWSAAWDVNTIWDSGEVWAIVTEDSFE